MHEEVQPAPNTPEHDQTQITAFPYIVHRNPPRLESSTDRFSAQFCRLGFLVGVHRSEVD